MKIFNLLLSLICLTFTSPSFSQTIKFDSYENLKKKGLDVAIVAGGCFWCMEKPFDDLKGVKETISGYTGGTEQSPTYEQVAYGKTSHCEAVRIVFDPKITSYKEILNVFWRNIDPTQVDGQFVDKGKHYRTGIFYLNEDQRKIAEKSKIELDKSKRFSKPIVTEVTKASPFYAAEDYHQDYYKKSALRYKFYRSNSGRDQFLKKYWGDK